MANGRYFKWLKNNLPGMISNARAFVAMVSDMLKMSWEGFKQGWEAVKSVGDRVGSFTTGASHGFSALGAWASGDESGAAYHNQQAGKSFNQAFELPTLEVETKKQTMLLREIRDNVFTNVVGVAG